MKKLYWDVETSTLDLLVKAYRLKNHTSYYNPDWIQRDWTMLGAAWAFDDKPPRGITIDPSDPFDDRRVIEKLHGVLNSADVLIGHNSDAFDYKMFNTRAIYYGLDPIGPKVHIDTLKIAKKYFKFTSNKLSYVCKYLGLELKDSSPDWDAILMGDKKAIRYMAKYNKQDIIATRDLYKKLASFHDTHPRIKTLARDVENNEVINCRKCGGAMARNGVRLTATGKKRQMMVCRDCGGYQTEAYRCSKS